MCIGSLSGCHDSQPEWTSPGSSFGKFIKVVRIRVRLSFFGSKLTSRSYTPDNATRDSLTAQRKYDVVHRGPEWCSASKLVAFVVKGEFHKNCLFVKFAAHCSRSSFHTLLHLPECKRVERNVPPRSAQKRTLEHESLPTTIWPWWSAHRKQTTASSMEAARDQDQQQRPRVIGLNREHSNDISCRTCSYGRFVDRYIRRQPRTRNPG
ncbi:hypothetical protein B0H12DRAFT_1118176 [Mycena haematopus]|nr:hypothetical protein B0H12DRAFT_1118176 [Mycena haematopus]